MLEDILREQLRELVGIKKLEVCDMICQYIEDTYNVKSICKEVNRKNVKWKYELKIIKGSKTFCYILFAPDCLGVLIIFGKDERNKVEDIRDQLSNEILKLYDEVEPYHDGKWFTVELEDLSLLEDIKKLLLAKRKPDKK